MGITWETVISKKFLQIFFSSLSLCKIVILFMSDIKLSYLIELSIVVYALQKLIMIFYTLFSLGELEADIALLRNGFRNIEKVNFMSIRLISAFYSYQLFDLNVLNKNERPVFHDNFRTFNFNLR